MPKMWQKVRSEELFEQAQRIGLFQRRFVARTKSVGRLKILKHNIDHNIVALNFAREIVFLFEKM